MTGDISVRCLRMPSCVLSVAARTTQTLLVSIGKNLPPAKKAAATATATSGFIFVGENGLCEEKKDFSNFFSSSSTGPRRLKAIRMARLSGFRCHLSVHDVQRLRDSVNASVTRN